MLVLKGYFAVKIQPSEETVPSIELIACSKYAPLFIRKSMFGVTDDLFFPKVLSALKESIV